LTLILLVVVIVMGAALCVQHRTLMSQVMTDPLTGAFNRRHLDSSLSLAIERSCCSTSITSSASTMDWDTRPAIRR
jgi:PleD family two-component response regulator